MTNVVAKDNLGGGGIDKLVVREAQADTSTRCPPRRVGFAPPEAPDGLRQGVTTRSSGCITAIDTTGGEAARPH
jgi:hypothetical protein